MRWKRLSTTEKAIARVEKAKKKSEAFRIKMDTRWERAQVWTRSFAWWPYHDSNTGMVYFLEHVWARTRGCHHRTKEFRYKRDQSPIEVTVKVPAYWEYRGGKDCPEIKQDPGGL